VSSELMRYVTLAGRQVRDTASRVALAGLMRADSTDPTR